MVRIGRLIVALVVTALALAGCSGDPQPIIAKPLATPTPTPSASPSPTESATPKAESPEEFIRRWNEIQTDMVATGATDAYWSVSTKRCPPCKRIASTVSSYYEAGGYVKTEGWAINSIAAVNPGAEGPATFQVRVDSAPTRYKKSSSSPVERFTGGPLEYTFELARRNNSWLVDNYLVNAQ